LHSDIYRDIFMPGGVQNYLFPTAWTYGTGPHRYPDDRIGDQWFFNDEICQFNQTTKYSALDAPQPQNEPAFAAARSVDDDWYAAHAALTYADTIKIPYYQQSNWQDEQVGPRGLILWKHIHPESRTVSCVEGGTRTFDEPKKMAVSSGDHGWGQFHNRDLFKFFDLFLLDRCAGADVLEHRVESFFETRGDGTNQDFTAMAYGDDWPLEGTRWPKTYLRAGRSMTSSAPAADEGGSTYLSAVPTKSWFYETPEEFQGPEGELFVSTSHPDTVSWLSPPIGAADGMPVGPDGNFIVNGPILMDLWASVAGVDADLFVSVSDVYPATHPTNPGWISYLQRGWLKASHRAVDPLRSYTAPDPDQGGKQILVQPYMTHTNPQPLLPNQATEMQLEIFPLGHIFRPGHRVLIQIHTPPATDGLWGYTPSHPPALVTVLHDAAHPTWIQWPQITLPEDQPAPSSVDGNPGSLMTAPSGCKVPGGFPCLPPSQLDL
jgi:predicted acyl esterase